MARAFHVLVAEDEESDIFLLRVALRKSQLGMELLIARDGQEAVDYLKTAGSGENGSRRPVPNLLLLDLNMPRMNGFDVLDWLATHPEHKNLPVVILTSSNLEQDRQKAREMGVQDYRVKPHSIPALMEMLQDISARYLTEE